MSCKGVPFLYQCQPILLPTSVLCSWIGGPTNNLHFSTCSSMKEEHPAREQDTSPILLFQVDDIIMPNTSDRIHVYLIGGLLSTSNLSLSWSERSAKYYRVLELKDRLRAEEWLHG